MIFLKWKTLLLLKGFGKVGKQKFSLEQIEVSGFLPHLFPIIRPYKLSTKSFFFRCASCKDMAKGLDRDVSDLEKVIDDRTETVKTVAKDVAELLYQ